MIQIYPIFQKQRFRSRAMLNFYIIMKTYVKFSFLFNRRAYLSKLKHLKQVLSSHNWHIFFYLVFHYWGIYNVLLKSGLWGK